MTAEQEILSDLLAQLDASASGIADSLQLIGAFPTTVAEFEAMSTLQRVVSTGLLKQIEQLEDGLMRTFRTILKTLGVSLKGFYPIDIANHMIELDVIDDAAAWVAVVKLRNELVHEYPFRPADRFDRLFRAHDAIPLLRDATRRVGSLIQSKGLLA